MNQPFQLPRRTFLRGLGTLMALPYLESLAPSRVLGAAGAVPATAKAGGAAAAAAAAGQPPVRLAFVYVPNGINMADWTPKTEGAGFELPMILEPLKDLRSDFTLLSGLMHRAGEAGPDGAGDHARASATYLTAMRARKTQGADIKVGQSIDQYIAQQVGVRTRFPSLELGTDKTQLSGNCDSGYSCAYSFNISWRTESTPMPPEVDPRLAFERLFDFGRPGETAEMRARRERRQASVLDFVQEDARRLQAKLGRNDQRKLDEYLTAVRDLERRIQSADKVTALIPDATRPEGVPAKFADHVKLMFDIMTLAFRTDSTRVATFVMAHDGSGRPYPEIGVRDGHHDLSHHGDKTEKKEKIAKINRFHMEMFAGWLQHLKSVKEGDGTLLDNSLILYGSGLEDGNAHRHKNLPLLLAGRGGGSVTPGRHIRYGKDTPMANLFLSLADRMGAKADRFGDSTGRLEQMKA